MKTAKQCVHGAELTFHVSVCIARLLCVLSTLSEGQHGTPDTRWFEGGRLNASVNCVDRHVRSHRANKTAIIWESDDGKSCQSGNTRHLFERCSECDAGVSTDR